MFTLPLIWWNSIIPFLLGVTHGYDFIIPGIIGLIIAFITYVTFTYKKEPPIKSIKNTFDKLFNYKYKNMSQAIWKMN